MGPTPTFLSTILLLVTVLFPSGASACKPARLTTVFWEEPPKALPGEVVLQVRLARIEPQPGHSEITSLCGAPYEPKVTVLEVVAVAEGAFAPTHVTLLGWRAPEGAGWLVGKPKALDYSKFVYVKLGEPPLPEPVSIAWRCPPDHDCPPTPTGIFKEE